MMLSRRSVLAGASAAVVAAPLSAAVLAQSSEDDPYPLPPFNYSKIPEAFRPAIVEYTGRQWPGTVIVDTQNRQLYLVLQGGKAMRWGCAVGRDGFRWAGLADVGRKVMWPRWTPPKEMIARSPEKAKWANGMPGGPDNPLGARALYLYQNGNDTLYRIHGTTEPMSIGKNASSGCIRMINQDVIELYRRVPIGSRVVVLAEGV
ncbi:MAG: L,D-transpeptidase [Aestuariivirga sp.]|uniref:L,D-transpeptidase n=1 Tax=Aestuariivirga sp. TaxID=2650926 RepID=UPI0038D00A4A